MTTFAARAASASAVPLERSSLRVDHLRVLTTWCAVACRDNVTDVNAVLRIKYAVLSSSPGNRVVQRTSRADHTRR